MRYSGGDEHGEAGVLLDLIATGRPAWMKRGACRTADPSITWFPDLGDSGIEAKRICWACPVRWECHEWATSHPDPLAGIWGGTSAQERRRLRARVA